MLLATQRLALHLKFIDPPWGAPPRLRTTGLEVADLDLNHSRWLKPRSD